MTTNILNIIAHIEKEKREKGRQQIPLYIEDREPTQRPTTETEFEYRT